MKIEGLTTREDWRAYAAEAMAVPVSGTDARAVAGQLIANQLAALTAAVLSLQAPTQQRPRDCDYWLGSSNDPSRCNLPAGHTGRHIL